LEFSLVRPTLAAYARKYARAAVSLEQWRIIAREASWQSLPEVRATYGSADALKVKSGRVVTVFNIAGNRFRLVKGEMHWHGATPTTAMMHIAIQENLNGKVVEWM
jgi:mRNA-degrading endonuclease HigB of HigAB toxin-antitoxin module